MGKQNKLAAMFNIESGEGRLVILLLAYSFFIGFSRLLVNITAGTLLRERFGADAAQFLPYIYIGAAIAAPLTGFVYTRLEEKLSFSRLLAANFGVLAVTLTAFYVLFIQLPQAGWPAIAFYIYYYVLYALIMLAFWGLASRLLDLRQSKRLFGLIGAGMVVAMVISGFLVRPLVSVIGAFNLLLLAAAGILLCLAMMLSITRAFPTDQPPEKDSRPTSKKAPVKSGYTDLLKDRFVVLLVIVTALNLLAYFFIDNAFYDRVYVRFPEPDELASFLAEFLAISSLFNLGSRAFASGKLITRYGLLVGLLTLPLVLTASALAVTVVGTGWGAIPLLFWLVVMSRLLFRALGDAVDKPAFSILYQALPTARRLRVQTLIISVIEPMAGGLAGVMLLLLSLSAVQMFYAVLFILAGWIAAVVLVSGEYRAVLLNSLKTSKLGDLAFSTMDKSSLDVFEEQVKNPHPPVVAFALDILEEMEHESLSRFLRRALSHPEPAVRQDALQRIERLDLTNLRRDVRLRVNFETAVPVQATALRTLAKLGDEDVFEEVQPFLDHPNPQLRRGAMVGLLRSGGIEGILMAGEKLVRLIDSPDPTDRTFAAEVLGQVGQSGFYRPLLRLLQDQDRQVLRAALTAAGSLKNPKLWPLVASHLNSVKVRGTAVSTLVIGGESVLPVLETMFADTSQPAETLMRVARVCGQIGGPAAIEVLQAQLNYPNNDVRDQILASLSRCKFKVDDSQVAPVEQSIRAEAGNILWIFAALADIGQQPVTALLRSALLHEVRQSRARIFLLLSFVYDSRAVFSARDNLDHPSREKRAFALEVLENLLASREEKDILLPLFDENLSADQRLERLHDHFSELELRMGQHRRLQQVLNQSVAWISPWVQACALSATSALLKTNHLDGTEAETARQSIVGQLAANEPLLRETAVWSLFKLDRATYYPQFEALGQDENPVVARVARHLSQVQNGEVKMQSTIEKVIYLKSIGIFAEVPEEILAAVATNLEEMEVTAGETIVREGDISRGIYIINEGEVKIHHGEQVVHTMTEPEIFGELSALDSEPHSASVTAVKDTSLFVLDQDILYELMADHVEVARGIIRVLTRQLRAIFRADSGAAAPADTTQRKDVLIDGILNKLSE